MLSFSSRNLGGKFGVYLMEELGAENMGDIQQFSKKCLQQKFGDKDGYVIMYENQKLTWKADGKEIPGFESNIAGIC